MTVDEEYQTACPAISYTDASSAKPYSTGPMTAETTKESTFARVSPL
jgi:hypothetical protein